MLDQVLALMLDLDPEQLAQVQARAAELITAKGLAALDEAFAKAS